MINHIKLCFNKLCFNEKVSYNISARIKTHCGW